MNKSAKHTKFDVSLLLPLRKILAGDGTSTPKEKRRTYLFKSGDELYLALFEIPRRGNLHTLKDYEAVLSEDVNNTSKRFTGEIKFPDEDVRMFADGNFERFRKEYTKVLQLAVSRRQNQKSREDHTFNERILEETWETITKTFKNQQYLSKPSDDGLIDSLAYTIFQIIVMTFFRQGQLVNTQAIGFRQFEGAQLEYNQQVMTLAYGNTYRFHALKKLADKHDNCVAAQELGDYYYYGVDLQYGRDTRLTIPSDFTTAAAYYKKGCKSDYPLSLWAYGDMLLKGNIPNIPLSESREMSLDYFRKAIAVSDYAPAYNSIGIYYLDKGIELEATKQDPDQIQQSYFEALKYFEIGDRKGLAFSRNRLILFGEQHREYFDLYYNSRSQTPSQIRLELLEHCGTRNSWGQNRLGLYYLKSEEPDKEEKAFAAFSNAAENGLSWAYYNLALHFYGPGKPREDMDEYQRNLQTAADIGHPDALFLLFEHRYQEAANRPEEELAAAFTDLYPLVASIERQTQIYYPGREAKRISLTERSQQMLSDLILHRQREGNNKRTSI